MVFDTNVQCTLQIKYDNFPINKKKKNTFCCRANEVINSYDFTLTTSSAWIDLVQLLTIILNHTLVNGVVVIIESRFSLNLRTEQFIFYFSRLGFTPKQKKFKCPSAAQYLPTKVSYRHRRSTPQSSVHVVRRVWIIWFLSPSTATQPSVHYRFVLVRRVVSP